MRLVKDASQRADGDFALLRDNRRVHGFSRTPHELYVTALLAGLHEARRFKPALDLTEGLRLKPPQPQPRSFGLSVGESPAVARNAVRELLADSPALLLLT